MIKKASEVYSGLAGRRKNFDEQMKIGLVLSGNLRSYRHTLSSFNKLKETLQQSGQVDVFCHTWNIEESVTPSWWKENKPGNTPPATVSNKQIEESFSPVEFIIESSRQFDDSGYNFPSSVPFAGVLSMLHSQYEAYRLLKAYEQHQGFQYDVVLKSRYDLLYEIAAGFNNIVTDSATNEILYIPSSNPYELIGSGSDIFAIGSRNSIEKYFSFCSNFKEAVSHYASKGYRQFLPELCMTDYLRKIGIKKKELTGLRLHILRMNGDKFQINSDRNFPGNGPLCFYAGTIELCSKILPGNAITIKENSEPLVKKYMSWIDPAADDKMLQRYADFYNGTWIGKSKITKLAAFGKNNSVYTKNVMKNFFEEAMRNANYGSVRCFYLASILYVYSGYGIFFFKVWKSVTFNKK